MNFPDSIPLSQQLGFPQFESRGFFMLAHSVFEDPALRALPGDTFRLFLWMSARAWKYRDSTGLVRASISYAAAGVGLSEACVSRGFRLLTAAGLIAVQERNFKLGNLWKVSSCAALRKGPTSKGPQKEGADVECVAPSFAGSTHLIQRQEVPASEGEVISIKNTKTSKKAESPVFEDKAQAFLLAFETAEEQAAAVRRYAGDIPAFKSMGQAARAFAVTRWWDVQSQAVSSADHRQTV